MQKSTACTAVQTADSTTFYPILNVFMIVWNYTNQSESRSLVSRQNIYRQTVICMYPSQTNLYEQMPWTISQVLLFLYICSIVQLMFTVIFTPLLFRQGLLSLFISTSIVQVGLTIPLYLYLYYLGRAYCTSIIWVWLIVLL